VALLQMLQFFKVALPHLTGDEMIVSDGFYWINWGKRGSMGIWRASIRLKLEQWWMWWPDDATSITHCTFDKGPLLWQKLTLAVWKTIDRSHLKKITLDSRVLNITFWRSLTPRYHTRLKISFEIVKFAKNKFFRFWLKIILFGMKQRC